MAQSPEMQVKEIRAAILREWFALAPDQRATMSQAAMFADKAIKAHGFAADGDAGATVQAWLARYTGLTPIY
jgi:hypothetical protein